MLNDATDFKRTFIAAEFMERHRRTCMDCVVSVCTRFTRQRHNLFILWKKE